MKNKRWTKVFELVIKSVKKIKLNIFLFMLIDLIPYLLVIFGLLLIDRTSSGKLIGLPSRIDLMSIEQLNSLLTTIYSFIAYILILILLWIAAGAFTKGYAYSRIFNKQFSFEAYKKFLLLNCVWAIPWVTISFALFKVIKPEIFVYMIPGFIFLWLHFTTILFVLFTQENKLGKIKAALSIGIKQFHQFILPYLAVIGIGILMALILLIALALLALTGIPETILGIIYLTLIIATFLFAIAFARIYIVEVIHSVLKKED